MSASEKLKVLDGRFEGLRIGDTPPPVVELLFWPQIVAVVEAAENNEYATDAFDKALHAALDALEEVLS